MADKKTQVTHEVETWSWQKAESALSTNEVNRSLRKANVEKFSRDMVSGSWREYTAPIVFDSEGKLIDGQHRLHAQVKANVTLKWLVIRGVDPDTQTTIDVGAARSVADVLQFAGEEDPQLLTAITRLVALVIDDGLTRGRYSMSFDEILRTLEDHPEIRRSREVARWFVSTKLVPLAPSVIGCAHWMIGQINGIEEADRFIRRLGTLANEKEGSPVLALSGRVNEIRRMQMRVNARDLLNLVLKTWNYDAQNRPAKQLTLYSRSGEFKLQEVLKRETPQESVGEDGAV